MIILKVYIFLQIKKNFSENAFVMLSLVVSISRILIDLYSQLI